MRFNLIREPEENPTDLLKSYRQQNIIMQKIRVLHTAFDGIKLTNWSDSNRELPNILIGSVCEFGGRLFETTDNIILTDNDDADGERFIRLEIVRENPPSDSDGDYLIAEVVSSEMPEYDYYNRGFYSKVDGVIKYKYLRVSMKYDKTLGGYVEKKYWNISDLMRAGITFKKHSVLFGVGTHEFEVPDNANSITVHICSGGAGGGEMNNPAKPGEASRISINGKNITTCSGGTIGEYTYNSYHRRYDANPGKGGIASGQGMLIQGNNVQGNRNSYGNIDYLIGAIFVNNTTLARGGNGGNSPLNGFGLMAGGSGSAAIVEITRVMLEGSKKVTITVGKGGAYGKDGIAGQDGSAVVEYFSRG